MRTAGLVMLIGALGGWLAMQIRRLQRLEDAYRESAAAFRLLAENSSDVIVRLSDDMRRLYVSPACRDVLGYEPEELLGGRTDDLVHPDDIASVAGDLRRPLARSGERCACDIPGAAQGRRDDLGRGQPATARPRAAGSSWRRAT